MKNDLDKNRIRINQLLWLSIVSIWIFYMWILSETPYEIDDWSWGISEGWHALVTGELNGRYLSNLLEVIVSRSPLMKTLFVGTMAMLMPLLATVLCLRFSVCVAAVSYPPDSSVETNLRLDCRFFKLWFFRGRRIGLSGSSS